MYLARPKKRTEKVVHERSNLRACGVEKLNPKAKTVKKQYKRISEKKTIALLFSQGRNKNYIVVMCKDVHVHGFAFEEVIIENEPFFKCLFVVLFSLKILKIKLHYKFSRV